MKLIIFGLNLRFNYIVPFIPFLLFKIERPNLDKNVFDEEILELMGIKDNGRWTLTGIMIFSKYPQAYFPQFSITAVRVQGDEMGDLSNDGARFIDNKRITGTIDEMVEGTVDFVRKCYKRKNT